MRGLIDDGRVGPAKPEHRQVTLDELAASTVGEVRTFIFDNKTIGQESSTQ